MIWDLSHKMENDQPRFATHTQYFRMMWSRLEEGGNSAHAQIIMGEHSGTHVDAPSHFFRGRKTIDQLPLESFVGSGRCIDVRHVGPGEAVLEEDITRFESASGSICAGEIVLFCFGFDALWGPGSLGKGYSSAWPGVSGEVARLLVQRSVRAVGTDAISIDASGSLNSPAHHALLAEDVPIYENLTGLSRLLGRSFKFCGVPLLIGEGTGSPVRAWAEGDLKNS